MTLQGLGLVLALLGTAAGTPQQPSALSPELAEGKRLVAAQKYQEAVAVLVKVVGKFPWTGAPDPTGAEAFLQLGLAYAGLGQDSPATRQFLQAIRRDPAVAPDPQTTPKASLDLFASAVNEAKEVELVDKAAKKRGNGIWIAAGAGALLAGGAAVVASTGGEGTGPDRGSVPNISNLIVGQIQSVDSTIGVLTLEFDFLDSDGDINTITIWVAGLAIANNLLPEAAAKTQGHITVTQSVRLPTRGRPVNVQVNVTDNRGLRSNILSGTTVWP